MSPRNRNILIASVVFVAMIWYGYWTLIYKPLHAEIGKVAAKVQELQQKLQVVEERAKQLARIQAEMANLQVDVAELEKQLPHSRDLPALIRTFSRRAETFGLTVFSFAPGRPVSKGGYDEIPYAVSLTSSFHTLGRFLTAMGKGERLMAARNVSLASNVAKNDPSKTVNATFTLITFKYHE